MVKMRSQKNIRPPNRPNVRLGEVTAEPSSDSVPVQNIEAKLRQAAAQMGADAVVIVSDRTQVTGAMITGPWYGRTLQRTTARVIVGVAIKYTNP
jgi:L-amino acid N-acyltransferase YncA